MLHRTNNVPPPAQSLHNHALKPCSRIPPCSAAIIAVLPRNETNIMEAEHINSISNKLDDLAQRAAELRRYL